MYDYVTSELPSLLQTHLPNLDDSHASIMGHSMGGHGALTLFLKNPHRYKAVSAFSPIVHPIEVPWGKKGSSLNESRCVPILLAFSGYLGEDRNEWKAYDACELMKTYSGQILFSSRFYFVNRS